eukprot:jgi/Galph1/1754/GphlegSOOS_G449.1
MDSCSVEGPLNSMTCETRQVASSPSHQNTRVKKTLLGFLRFVGPGWLVGVALMDPGNYESAIQAGTQYDYQLLWAFWWSIVISAIYQIIAIYFGLYSNFDLATACRQYYPRWVSVVLWLLMEVTTVSTDIVEVVGFAVAIRVLFSWPLYGGVLLSCITTLLLLAFRYIGFRSLEVVVMLLALVLSISFFVQWGEVKTDWGQFMQGWVIPRVPSGAALVVLATLGTDVVPQNFYLQSFLVRTRKVVEEERSWAFFSNVFETVIPFVLAFFLNSAIIALAYADFYHNKTLDSQYLSSVGYLIRAGCIIWAISLLASGQSTAMTATYTAQVMMEGFINIRMTTWLRSLLTRIFALIPALLVVSIFGSHGANMAILIGAAIPSGTLPFAVIPLMKFTTSRQLMKEHVLSRWYSVPIVLLSTALIGLNIYLMVGANGKHTLQHLLAYKSTGAIIGIVFTAIIGVTYLLFIVYVVWYPIGWVNTEDAFETGSI